MAYNILGPDDSNLQVTITEGDVTTINIQPASFTITGSGAPVDSVNGYTGVVVLDTDDVNEGSVNLYYSDALVDANIASKTTDDLTEGSNLYYTDARVDTHLADGTITDIRSSQITVTGGTGTQGQITWNADEETLDLIQNGATLQLGQELQWHCRNNTASTIPDGTAVMATGTLGASGRLTIAPMVADGSVPAKYFLGITTETIGAGEDGKVTHFGKVRGLNTSSYAEGAVLYLDPTTPGGLTATEPGEPNIKIPAAFVINSHANNGTLAIRVTTLDENLYATHADVFSGDYNDLINQPTIPTVPTLVSAFTNDAGYLTSYTETDPIFSAWDKSTGITITESQITDLSHFSGDYNDLINQPTIPTVPTLISAFTNDTGYITGYTVTESDVTAHQAALTITESQISDLSHYTDADAISAVSTNADNTFTGNLTVNGDFVVLNQVKLNNFEFPLYDAGRTDAWVGNAETLRADYAYNKVQLRTDDPTITFDFSQFFDVANNARTGLIMFDYRSGNGNVNFADTILWEGGVQPNFATVSNDRHIVEFLFNSNGIRARVISVANNSFTGTTSILSHYQLNQLGNVATTTPTDGQALVWVDANSQWEPGTVSGGGGASALNDLTDVTVTTPSDGDILRYNGIAGEFQNTNLGLSLTPTLSGVQPEYAPGGIGNATISNWGDYDDPNMWAQVLDSGDNVVVTPSQITDNNDGTFNFPIPSTEATGYKLQVKVQDFGDLASDTAEATFDVASITIDATFRYFRITDYSGRVDSSGRIMVGDFRLYSGTGGTGTVYPTTMTSNTAPSPFVASASHLFSTTYDYWKAFDATQNNTFYWNLGESDPYANWLQIDLGASTHVQSLAISHGQSGYSFTGCKIYGSDTGAFAGEETLVANIVGLLSPWASNDRFIIG